MFDNPILFALLIGAISSLLFFFVNKNKDKRDKNPNKNTKYLVVFGIVFVICLIGKIVYSGNTLEKIEEHVEKVIGGGMDLPSSISSDSFNKVGESVQTGETPPF
jgi:multisubunit Na+/H+ antiporter MnhB subunit